MPTRLGDKIVPKTPVSGKKHEKMRVQQTQTLLIDLSYYQLLPNLYCNALTPYKYLFDNGLFIIGIRVYLHDWLHIIVLAPQNVRSWYKHFALFPTRASHVCLVSCSCHVGRCRVQINSLPKEHLPYIVYGYSNGFHFTLHTFQSAYWKLDNFYLDLSQFAAFSIPPILLY